MELAAMTASEERPVLVTDFDGTLTDRDFYQLVRERLLPAGTPDFWAAYRRGDISHFEALGAYFEAALPGEERLARLVEDMGLEPELRYGVELLDRAGWRVVVVSNGCRWYIDRLLARAGVELEVHANPGRVVEGRLMMEWPEGTAFPSAQTGISKAAVVRSFLVGGRAVAFAGDGPPDLEPALLVPPQRRFARSHLAEALTESGEAYRSFSRWLEIARTLAAEGTS
jgi:2-hydroxy-3-keto-5-methylthiopentenyl-1-phosphate phosphatase